MSKRSHKVPSPAPAARPGMTRRGWLGVASTGVLGIVAGATWWTESRAAGPSITVYASPSCGCCKEWMRQMRASGFDLNVEYMEDVTPYKKQLHVPQELWACHSAVVGDYVVEGHVPADLVRRILVERPAIVGLATPGMPMGAPGMDATPVPEPYKVMSFDARGHVALYAVRS